MVPSGPCRARVVASVLALYVVAASPGCGRRGPGREAAARAPGSATASVAGDAAVPMEKVVSHDAAFVVYKPRGWVVNEQRQPGFQVLTVGDPAGEFEAAMFYGASPTGDDVPALAGMFGGRIASRFPDFRVTAAMTSPDRRRVVFDAEFTTPGKGARELRVWVTGAAGQFVYSSIEAPAGRMAERRRLLLTILSNVRAIRGGLAGAAAAPSRVAMAPYRLRDGSASFLLPAGWQVQELGKGGFLAGEAASGLGFMVGAVNVVPPRFNLHYPGVVVSPYLPPDRAWAFVTSHFGLATNLRFDAVSPRRELAAAMAAVHTAGPVEVEDLVYTYTSREGRASKGYTLGFSFGSRLDIGWSFRHLTVAAPADRFDAFVPSFTAMLESYRINEDWAAQYIAQGVQHLRQLQQQTSAIVTRNAQEIHQMMQDAYDERQRSHDYIDYQFTNFIRGQQDWVSSVEGGTVYHSDSWGTRNTTTGESWEGQPFNSVNFEGDNPKYREQMQAIDSRALFERYVR